MSPEIKKIQKELKKNGWTGYDPVADATAVKNAPELAKAYEKELHNHCTNCTCEFCATCDNWLYLVQILA